MNTPTQPNTIGQEARALLKTLEETFPVIRDHAPLAIGIDKQLIAKLPEVNRKQLRVALSMHTNSLRYLKTLEKATHRLDLEGNPAEEITEEHRKHATEVLRERFKKNAERIKARKEAETAERKRNEAERQRTEKLSQLVEKFSKTR
ncbi:ProQ/FINO family protein [Propionivibrio limicola]|uniref:ProQ/FINO family protein n=1 Tax=Propionivibrio limicola TaxID=167645 RepID=UPI001291E299|nr:ProQ/FinO family protein [Propionivibrio limicola]